MLISTYEVLKITRVRRLYAWCQSVDKTRRFEDLAILGYNNHKAVPWSTANSEKRMRMATHAEQAKIVCPCCQATLVLDRDTLAILYYTEHREKAGGASFEGALKEHQEKEKQKSLRFQQAMVEEKQRRALLGKKFQELQKHAAEHPDERPVRPFDLE
jgi:hypothetical protein